MSPTRTNRNRSLSLTSLLFVIISLVKSCEAQSDSAIVFISIPTLIILFFVCALCWLSCAIKMMRDSVPRADQQTAGARRSNLPILAITPYAGYRRAYLLPDHSLRAASRPHASVPSTSIRAQDTRPRPNPSATRINGSSGVNPTKLTVHNPYDDVFVMDAMLHQAEAPPDYEDAIKMPADSNADHLERESNC